MTHQEMSLIPTAHPTPPHPLACVPLSSDFFFMRVSTLTLQKYAYQLSCVCLLCLWSPPIKVISMKTDAFQYDTVQSGEKHPFLM